MKTKKSVVILGAGISGLLSIKSCLEEGLNVTCYELTEYIGGVWKYREDSPDHVSVLQRSTIINSSKEMSAFSDFPPPSKFPNFMHHKRMWSYINDYASKFNLLPYIKLNHKVVSCTNEKDKWIIKGCNTQTGEPWEDTADAVMVCNGHLSKPKIPNIPGLEDFKGRIIHTRDYRRTTGFDDKNVLVIGIGTSGCDAAAELSTVTNKLYLSVRTGAWVVSRIGEDGTPGDFMVSRHLGGIVNTFPSLANSMVEKSANKNFDHELFGIKPNHRFLEQHPMVNDHLPNGIISGRITIKGGIDHFTKDGVYFFNDNKEYKIDVVILATGYLIDLPFLDDKITSFDQSQNAVKLYKFIIPPKNPSIAIIGLVNVYGPFTPVAEAQARWYVQYLIGKLQLPSCEKMHAEIEKTDMRMKQRFRKTRRYTIEVDLQNYMDDLYQQIRAKPNMASMLFKDPQLFWKCWFGPILPYQFRLEGPHKWNGARNAIMTVDDRVREPLLRADKNKIGSRKFNHKAFLISLIFAIFSIYLTLKHF